VTAFETYKLYIALKNHFNSPSYDFFRHNGKVRASFGAFEKRHDKHFFEILSKHKDVQRFILANIVDDNPNLWVSQIANEQTAEMNYKKWLKRQESLTYLFKNELEALDDDFNANMVCEDGHHPILLKKTLQGVISTETLIILNDFAKFFRYWNKKINEDIIWPAKLNLFKKYKPFINYDSEKYKKIVVDRFKCS
jgi:hypothetical protein